MRLLVIAPDFPNTIDATPGGIFVKEQVLELAKHFEDISVIVPQPKTFGRYPEIERMKDYSIGNVQVHYPRYFYLPISFFRKKIPRLHERSVRKTIDKNDIKFDMIHSHFTDPSGIVGFKIKKETSVPMILTIHENSGWFDREISSGDQRFQEVWKGVDLVLRAKKDDIEKLRGFNDNVHSVPIGFNSSTLNPIPKKKARENLGVHHDRLILFSLGNLIKRKGYDHLIRAVKILVDGGLAADCYIAGGGEELEALKKLSNELGLADRVRFLGRISNESKRQWLSAADLFVLSSLSESFGLVQLEAMACGAPVVATRNGGSEWVMSDIAGLLCEPGDPEDLARKIGEALERHWDKGAIVEYASQYDWSRINEQILELIGKMGVKS
jgi:glycosyltransferase involved in cell wall biosynthesis